MTKIEETKLLETFRRLEPEGQLDVLALVRVAYATQENTKRRFGLPSESITTQDQTQKASV